MASIPQQQISNAYYYCLRYPRQWYGFGRGYNIYYDGMNSWKLVHYGTTIYECNTATKKAKADGWSISDVMAINSLAYHTGTKGAYMTKEQVYLEGTGPRYAPKKKKATSKTNDFGMEWNLK